MGIKVLFLIKGSAARTQLAEHLLNYLGRGDFIAVSAGLDPTPLDPLAIAVLSELGIAADSYGSVPVELLHDDHFDYIITVCDRSTAACKSADVECPHFPGDTRQICWGFDAADSEGEEELRHLQLRRVRDQIVGRLRIWIPAVIHARKSAQQRQ